ncbi:hypothetical protein LR48_Vigan11g126900 [Vigna angularis]|uniref:Uncharacterized protein n=1 Tax=Phaseolus angularis TaxID=3914 RepID=A0A0L9VT33_PHAAN|nr:hypothetical protein LR48_Vigan11g126900 [Vigna angularis]
MCFGRGSSSFVKYSKEVFILCEDSKEVQVHLLWIQFFLPPLHCPTAWTRSCLACSWLCLPLLGLGHTSLGLGHGFNCSVLVIPYLVSVIAFDCSVLTARSWSYLLPLGPGIFCYAEMLLNLMQQGSLYSSLCNIIKIIIFKTPMLSIGNRVVVLYYNHVCD